MTLEEWNKIGLPRAQGVCSRTPIQQAGNQRVIYYRIPMTGFDTIYHELVHAYDPKFVRKNSQLGDMLSPHEVDAHIAGFIDLMKEKLLNSDENTKNELIEELKEWLRKNKQESELEPYNMPRLLAGMPIFHLKQYKKLWNKFLTSVHSAINASIS